MDRNWMVGEFVWTVLSPRGPHTYSRCTYTLAARLVVVAMVAEAEEVAEPSFLL